jgi:hypothetical protein
VAVVLGAYALVLAPWTGRNYLVFGRFVPVSTMGGIVFYQGFHPPRPGWGFTPWEEIQRLTGGIPSEPEVSDALVEITLADIASRPLEALRLLPLKLAGFFNPFSEHGAGIDAVYLAVAALGLAGAVAAARRPAGLLPALALAYFVVLALVFYGSPRFRLPVEPLLLALAAVWVVEAVASRRGRAVVALLALGAVALGWIGPDREQARSLLERAIGYRRDGSAASEPSR